MRNHFIIFFLLMLNIFVNGQCVVKGEATYSQNWRLAKDPLQIARVIPNNIISVSISVNTTQGSFAKTISSNSFDGTKFRFRNIPTPSQITVRYYSNGLVNSNGRPASYEYSLNLKSGQREQVLPKLVYLVEEGRWVPLKTIK
jgi:hypothetical protein